MTQRGATSRVAAATLWEDRETCPRCRARVERVVSLVACSELTCDWSRPRLDGRRFVEPPKAKHQGRPRGEVSRQRGIERMAAERELLLAELKRGPATSVELSQRTGVRQGRVREVFAGYEAVEGERRGPAFTYRIKGGAIAC